MTDQYPREESIPFASKLEVTPSLIPLPTGVIDATHFPALSPSEAVQPASTLEQAAAAEKPATPKPSPDLFRSAASAVMAKEIDLTGVTEDRPAEEATVARTEAGNTVQFERPESFRDAAYEELQRLIQTCERGRLFLMEDLTNRIMAGLKSQGMSPELDNDSYRRLVRRLANENINGAKGIIPTDVAEVVMVLPSKTPEAVEESRQYKRAKRRMTIHLRVLRENALAIVNEMVIARDKRQKPKNSTDKARIISRTSEQVLTLRGMVLPLMYPKADKEHKATHNPITLHLVAQDPRIQTTKDADGSTLFSAKPDAKVIMTDPKELHPDLRRGAGKTLWGRRQKRRMRVKAAREEARQWRANHPED
jgi:hypothetical protein